MTLWSASCVSQANGLLNQVSQLAKTQRAMATDKTSLVLFACCVVALAPGFGLGLSFSTDQAQLRDHLKEGVPRVACFTCCALS